MNWYTSLDDVKTRLGITATTDDALLGMLIEQASRDVDEYCGRHFYVETATRYFDTGKWWDRFYTDDLLSVSSFTVDAELDDTWTGETWTASDYYLMPDNSWPKTIVMIAREGDYWLPRNVAKYVKITGSFGYGDGLRQSPVDSITQTITVGSTTATTVTASASGVKAGWTLLVGSEQMFVSSVSGTTLTCKRGVNGTTAATHSTAAASVYCYPTSVKRYVEIMASQEYGDRFRHGLIQERIGNYSYQRTTPDSEWKTAQRVLGGVKRVRT